MTDRPDAPPAANTDRELYREDTGNPAGSYYENSVLVTEDGRIGMNVGGRVVALPIAEWHTLAWHRRMSDIQTQNADGAWVPAVPLPYYGLRKRCSCGRRFWTMEGYQGHYALAHILKLTGLDN